MVPSIHSNFQYCDSNIGLFFAPCKVITPNPLCTLFGVSSLLLFYGYLSKVISLPTIAIAIVVALSRFNGDGEKITVFFANAFESVKERQLLL